MPEAYDSLIYTCMYMMSKEAIADIGTNILFVTCFSHNSTHIAPPELAFSVDYTNFCVDSESAVKTY